MPLFQLWKIGVTFLYVQLNCTCACCCYLLGFVNFSPVVTWWDHRVFMVLALWLSRASMPKLDRESSFRISRRTVLLNRWAGFIYWLKMLPFTLNESVVLPTARAWKLYCMRYLVSAVQSSGFWYFLRM